MQLNPHVQRPIGCFQSHMILRCPELRLPACLHITWCDVNFTSLSSRCVVKFSENIALEWTPGVHLSLFNAVKDVQSVIDTVKGRWTACKCSVYIS